MSTGDDDAGPGWHAGLVRRRSRCTLAVGGPQKSQDRDFRL